MSTETIEIFNNSDEWANQLKHAIIERRKSGITTWFNS